MVSDEELEVGDEVARVALEGVDQDLVTMVSEATADDGGGGVIHDELLGRRLVRWFDEGDYWTWRLLYARSLGSGLRTACKVWRRDTVYERRFGPDWVLDGKLNLMGRCLRDGYLIK